MISKYNKFGRHTLGRITRTWSVASIALAVMQPAITHAQGGGDCLLPCQYRTQTQGGWGAPPSGDNPGAYLHANFGAAFPMGLEIGCINKLALTSAQAVTDFLPSGSTASPLPPGTLTDPGSDYNNVLAGQLVALKLSVGFDAYDPEFGQAGSLLKDAVIASGAFAGNTVEELIEMTDQFIGGCGGMHTASQLNDALSMVNENNVDGTTNNGNLECIAVVISVSDVITCYITSAQIEVDDCVVTPGRSYSWTGPLGFVSTAQCPVVTVGGLYVVTITDPSFPAPLVCDATVVQNTVPPPAACSFDGDQVLNCLVEQVKICLNSEVPNADHEYSWSGPNGFTSTDQCVFVTGPGLYTGRVTKISNGCYTECEIEVEQDITEPDLAIDGGDILCDEECTTLTASSTANVSFEWTLPDNSTVSGAVLEVCATGWYSVTAADMDNYCTTTQSIYVDQEECPCLLHTQTQGGWGTSASGNNPGAYRNANFAAAFPAGVSIGCTRTLTLTTSAAVEAFLPSGTSARVLNVGHMVNPGQSYKNVLAGQLVALKLSVGFDAYDPDFGEADGLLGDATVIPGLFAGMSVNAIIALADQFIGGCGGPYSASQLNDVLASINENYTDGIVDNGFLLCSGPVVAAKNLSILATGDVEAIDVFPNPANDLLNVRLVHEQAGPVQIELLDLSGRKIQDVAYYVSMENDERRHIVNVQDLISGVYLLSIQENGIRMVKRFVVSR